MLKKKLKRIKQKKKRYSVSPRWFHAANQCIEWIQFCTHLYTEIHISSINTRNVGVSVKKKIHWIFASFNIQVHACVKAKWHQTTEIKIKFYTYEHGVRIRLKKLCRFSRVLAAYRIAFFFLLYRLLHIETSRSSAIIKIVFILFKLCIEFLCMWFETFLLFAKRNFVVKLTENRWKSIECWTFVPAIQYNSCILCEKYV